MLCIVFMMLLFDVLLFSVLRVCCFARLLLACAVVGVLLDYVCCVYVLNCCAVC